MQATNSAKKPNLQVLDCLDIPSFVRGTNGPQVAFGRRSAVCEGFIPQTLCDGNDCVGPQGSGIKKRMSGREKTAADSTKCSIPTTPDALLIYKWARNPSNIHFVGRLCAR